MPKKAITKEEIKHISGGVHENIIQRGNHGNGDVVLDNSDSPKRWFFSPLLANDRKVFNPWVILKSIFVKKANYR